MYKFLKNYEFKILIILIPFFIFLTRLMPEGNLLFLKGERGLIEIVQLIILIFTLILSIKNKSKFIRKSNIQIFFFKTLLIIFLIYEELSFLITPKIKFIEIYNYQNELNIHNAMIWNNNLFYNFPFFGEISFMPVIITILTLILGFGSFFKIPRKYKFIFLEKKYRYFCFLYSFNLILTRLLFPNFSDYEFLIDPELIELYLYLLLLFDYNDKTKTKYN